MVIVSACLVGKNCKYNGGNNKCEWVLNFSKKYDCIFVCPERYGKLPTPRPPAEIINGRAIDKTGRDVTEELKLGAVKSLKRAEKAAKDAGQEIEAAILKTNSPSCGCGKIYDGTFTGKLVDGDGYFARLLKRRGIRVITEKENIV